MISNDEELRVTLSQIDRFHQQVARLRQVETNPTNYRLSAEGYLESGEDYGYSANRFFPIEVPLALQKALKLPTA